MNEQINEVTESQLTYFSKSTYRLPQSFIYARIWATLIFLLSLNSQYETACVKHLLNFAVVNFVACFFGA